MFNLQGSEIVIIMLLALVVLGPEKLPDAMRKAGEFYSEIKKMSSGFQKELKEALDEPSRELRETANLLRDSADFTKLANGDREEKPKSGEMPVVETLAPSDPDLVPTDELPFTGPDDHVPTFTADETFGAPAPTEPVAAEPPTDSSSDVEE